MARSTPLLLFAKAPIPGRVKTRLQTDCSAEQAAEIAHLLLEASLRQACTHWPGEVVVSTWLDIDHPVLLSLCERFGVKLVEQCNGSLGDKMQDAFESYGLPMAIMGCDAPHVTKATLTGMHSLLQQGKSAIAPSLDGGYYLIGLSEMLPSIFCDMPWGTSEVLGLTRERAIQAGLEIKELATLQDIDEWQDLVSELHLLPTIQRYLKRQNLLGAG